MVTILTVAKIDVSSKTRKNARHSGIMTVQSFMPVTYSSGWDCGLVSSAIVVGGAGTSATAVFAVGFSIVVASLPSGV